MVPGVFDYNCLSGVGSPPEAEYTEHSLFGYRWYDYNGVTPAYCFGHGLSFATFSYGALTTSASSAAEAVQKVQFEITNTGTVAGSEVAQLYLASPTATGLNGESKRQLKSFTKVKDLAPGASETVTFSLSARDVSAWDESAEDWLVVTGTYTVYVGTSSCDFRQSITFVVE